MNIPNIAKKRGLIVKTRISKDLEEIEEKSADKNSLRDEKDHDQKIKEKIKKEDTHLPDRYLKIEEI